MKIETLKLVKAEGMWACSGGIIGMGEDWEDRLDMAISLAEVGVDSIPLNALMLTTVACATIRSDKNMLKDIGRETK